MSLVSWFDEVQLGGPELLCTATGIDENLESTFCFCRKSVFSLNELGQMNGTAGGAGGLAEDEEMPEQHELGEELAFTGRWVTEEAKLQQS